MSCIFCEYLNSKKYIMENELAFSIYANYPVNEGHVLVMERGISQAILMQHQQNLKRLTTL
jgi:diadenosine tetraphosphate (Ap4A) HIT family hydrolase